MKMNSNKIVKELNDIANNISKLLENYKDDEYFDLKLTMQYTRLYSIADMISE
jgi:hypothetical protein